MVISFHHAGAFSSCTVHYSQFSLTTHENIYKLYQDTLLHRWKVSTKQPQSFDCFNVKQKARSGAVIICLYTTPAGYWLRHQEQQKQNQNTCSHCHRYKAPQIDGMTRIVSETVIERGRRSHWICWFQFLPFTSPTDAKNDANCLRAFNSLSPFLKRIGKRHVRIHHNNSLWNVFPCVVCCFAIQITLFSLVKRRRPCGLMVSTLDLEKTRPPKVVGCSIPIWAWSVFGVMSGVYKLFSFRTPGPHCFEKTVVEDPFLIPATFIY